MSKNQNNNGSNQSTIEKRNNNEGMADLKYRDSIVTNKNEPSAETITSHFAAPVNPDKTSGNKTKK